MAWDAGKKPNWSAYRSIESAGSIQRAPGTKAHNHRMRANSIENQMLDEIFLRKALYITILLYIFKKLSARSQLALVDIQLGRQLYNCPSFWAI